MNKYRYSFVLYAYNQERFISDAVRGALAQDFEPLEILLSDDCSDDNTYDIMKATAANCRTAHSVKLNRNERNLGTNAHIERSLELILGDIIIVAGGDDVSHSNRAREIIQYFERHDPLLVHSLVNPIDANKRSVPRLDPQGYLSKADVVKPAVAATAMSLHVGATAAWNRVLFDKYGPIRDAASYEDLVLGFRAVLEGRVGFINDRLLDYRVGQGVSWGSKPNVDSLRKHKQLRLLKHRRERAVLRQRLSDCRTFGLGHDDPLVQRIQRALRTSELSVDILEGAEPIGRSRSLLHLYGGARLRLRELVAVLKWWVLRMNASRRHRNARFPPRSKILRELVRVLDRTLRFPTFVLNSLLGTPYHDIILNRRRRVHEGLQSSTDKVAIYAIYPAAGIRPSHVSALQHLLASGYTPLVVSNRVLKDHERARILEHCTQLIERPNYGYDFGAYRDGILHLRSRISSIERLALFNDSCWFPVPSHANWLRKAEKLNRDLVSSTSDGFIKRPSSGGPYRVLWSYDESLSMFCYNSFSLLLSNSLICHPGFLRFWRRLKLTNNKRQTVKRGEIGFTRWVKGNDFSHGSTIDMSKFDKDVERLTHAQLRDVLDNLMVTQDSNLIEAKRELLEEYRRSDAWKSQAVDFVLFAASRVGVGYSMGGYLVRDHNFGFLKKLPIRLNEDAAQVMARVAGKLNVHCDFDLLDEVAEVRSMSKHN